MMHEVHCCSGGCVSRNVVAAVVSPAILALAVCFSCVPAFLIKPICCSHGAMREQLKTQNA
jgi:hypothetical protein